MMARFSQQLVTKHACSLTSHVKTLCTVQYSVSGFYCSHASSSNTSHCIPSGIMICQVNKTSSQRMKLKCKYVRFGTFIYKQEIGIPMGTNCAPLVADLFLYCYERDFMLSLSAEHQDDIITAFNNTSRYLGTLMICCIQIITIFHLWLIKFFLMNYNFIKRALQKNQQTPFI